MGTNKIMKAAAGVTILSGTDGFALSIARLMSGGVGIRPNAHMPYHDVRINQRSESQHKYSDPLGNELLPDIIKRNIKHNIEQRGYDSTMEEFGLCNPTPDTQEWFRKNVISHTITQCPHDKYHDETSMSCQTCPRSYVPDMHSMTECKQCHGELVEQMFPGCVLCDSYTDIPYDDIKLDFINHHATEVDFFGNDLFFIQ